MEHYNTEISSEVKTQPKNKKKIVLISVVSVAIVLVVLMSVLIPVLILRTPKPTEESYFEFKSNEDDMSYAIVGYKRFLPETIVIPETYDGYPVTDVSIKSNLVKEIYISKNVKDFYFECPNIEKVELDSKISNFIEKEQVIYTADMKSLVLCEPQKTGDFMIPREIDAKAIYPEAFVSCNLDNVYVTKESNFNILLNEITFTEQYALPRFTKNLNLLFENGYEDFDMDKFLPGGFTQEEIQQSFIITFQRVLCVKSLQFNSVMPYRLLVTL